jgi:nucleoside phosphorylase
MTEIEFRNFIEANGLDELQGSLSGIHILIGVSSKTDEIIEIAKNLENFFQCFLKADVTTTISDSIRYESEIMQRKIREANIVVMLAATPGISAKALDICHRCEKYGNIDIDKILVYMPENYGSGSISRLLRTYKANLYFLPEEVFYGLGRNHRLILRCIHDSIGMKNSMRSNEELHKREFSPNIAIVTALVREMRAVQCIFEPDSRDVDPEPDQNATHCRIDSKPDQNATHCRIDSKPDQNGIYQEFYYGDVKSEHGGCHKVVAARCDVGNNKASILGTILLERYPSIEVVLMVGIAGGVPAPGNAEKHVRLGDIVICDDKGIIQYDKGKKSPEEFEPKPPPRPIDPKWSQRCQNLIGLNTGEPKYWTYLDDISSKLDISRPRKGSFKDCEGKVMRHPRDKKRKSQRPKVHIGTIVSSNTLLRDPRMRDQLKDDYEAMAIEMESSGIADATYVAGAGYLVVRGISDYADTYKDDIWQDYAAAAAAAFAKELISSMRVNF